MVVYLQRSPPDYLNMNSHASIIPDICRQIYTFMHLLISFRFSFPDAMGSCDEKGEKKSYRVKSKKKIRFKDCNKTITELCQTFNNLFSISSKSVLTDQLEYSSGHPYGLGL